MTCVSSADFFAPALPVQLFLSQHCCFFAPVSLVQSFAVWVTLALQNMPPKARAPEALTVCVGGTRFLGLNFAHVPGQADVSPQYAFPAAPDQGRATATISSRFGCMELSCHHQRTLSPMLQRRCLEMRVLFVDTIAKDRRQDQKSASHHTWIK